MTQNLIPLEAPYPADVAKVLATYPTTDGYILKLFRTFATSMRFLTKCIPNLLDKESPLSLRDREIVILRVTANRNCEYEWGVHVSVFSKAATLTADQVRASRLGTATDSAWQDGDQTLVGVVDALCSEGRLSDILQAAFQTHWDPAQQLEVMALCGTYQTISFVANVAQLDGEEFGAKFPTA